MTNRYTNVPKSDNKPENVVIIRGGGDLGQRYDSQIIPLRLPSSGTGM